RIRENPKFQRFKAAFESNPNTVIDFPGLHEEIARLHKTRAVRSLARKSKGFVDDVVDGLIQDQRVRSRCTEILGVCISVAGSMETTLDNLRDYIMIE